MKLYLISSNKKVGYDQYDSFVVCAKSPAAAKKIHPLYDGGAWVSTYEDIDVEFLGHAKKGSVEKVIISSFNAG